MHTVCDWSSCDTWVSLYVWMICRSIPRLHLEWYMHFYLSSYQGIVHSDGDLVHLVKGNSAHDRRICIWDLILPFSANLYPQGIFSATVRGLFFQPLYKNVFFDRFVFLSLIFLHIQFFLSSCYFSFFTHNFSFSV